MFLFIYEGKPETWNISLPIAPRTLTATLLTIAPIGLKILRVWQHCQPMLLGDSSVLQNYCVYLRRSRETRNKIVPLKAVFSSYRNHVPSHVYSINTLFHRNFAADNFDFGASFTSILQTCRNILLQSLKL